MQPWLWIPPQLAHDLSPYGLEAYAALRGSDQTPVWKPFQFKNLFFKNRLGIAGGVDKNGDHMQAWQRLGCGFLEIGTVTPEAQKPNPGKIMDRNAESFSLWNKMGFPSAGADEVFYTLKSFKDTSSLPIFVNIGKNRTTTNTDAYRDYIFLLEKFNSFADGFVVNISSPNTSGLRDLANKENLDHFLKPIANFYSQLVEKKPLLLKLSPDHSPEEHASIISAALHWGFDGFVMTNTTLSREGLSFYPAEGGASGKPLAELSKKALKTAVQACAKENTKKLIISTGGVMTADDVFERIDLGADLVQTYTGLIYNGPGFFRKVADVVNRGSKTLQT